MCPRRSPNRSGYALPLAESLALLALLTATTEYCPLAPTESCGLDFMRSLAQRKVIAVPWPSPDWPSGELRNRTLYEGFAWRYRWRISEMAAARTLEERLRSAPSWVEATELQMLQARLRVAEAFSYFEDQLEFAKLPREWSRDSTGVLSRLAQRSSPTVVRYYAWAAVRSGAAAVLRSEGNSRIIREAILRELQERPQRAEREGWQIQGFAPRQLVPKSLIASLFVKYMLRDPHSYWILPSRESRVIDRP